MFIECIYRNYIHIVKIGDNSDIRPRIEDLRRKIKNEYSCGFLL